MLVPSTNITNKVVVYIGLYIIQKILTQFEKKIRPHHKQIVTELHTYIFYSISYCIICKNEQKKGGEGVIIAPLIVLIQFVFFL